MYRRQPHPALSVAAAAAAIALAGCSVDMPGGMGPGMMHGSDRSSQEAPPSPVAGAREITVVADDFSFEPSTIELTAGEEVSLTVRNRGQLYHDFVIEERGFTLQVEAGSVAGGGLRIDTPGSYPFRCSVPGHADAGMTGSIVVS
jgi:uncharacterized cupredoxin-like copper-binding protein